MMLPVYDVHGHGSQTLILLHSGGMSAVEWQPQIAALSSRYRLLVPDLPGHGRTLLSEEPLTISKMASSVLKMMEKESVTRAYICGSSMGAAVAMWLTLRYPEKVTKAIFFRISYRKNVATYQQTNEMATPAYWQRFGLEKWLSDLHYPQGGKEAWKRVIARVSQSLDPAHSEHQHKLEDFAQIKQPVLLIAGDRDPVAPMDELIALHRTIPNSGLWILPYTTHISATNTWRSVAFSEEILRFLGRREPD